MPTIIPLRDRTAPAAVGCADGQQRGVEAPICYDRADAKRPTADGSARASRRRSISSVRRLRVGEWVEVRSRQEILATLDADGRLEGMPFMPEMFQHCAQRFQVYKVAHKTCDYVNLHPFQIRRLERTVHLDTRCGGEAHGGCQAGCLLYWKEAWIRRIDEDADDRSTSVSSMRCDEAALRRAAVRSTPDNSEPLYVCQATQVPDATTPLAWWDVRQYLDDYRSGNVGLGRILQTLVYSSYYNLSEAGIGLGRPMRWLYDRLRWIWAGSRWPRTPGRIAEGAPTPKADLCLQPGELVRVKSHEEILNTVTTGQRNRGMFWDAELVPYCGGVYRVLKRVSKIIDERTGRMLDMKTPSIILDSVVCQARYSTCRLLCPRSMYPYWREIWLERVHEDAPTTAGEVRP
jgi:hypothetical protein